MNLSGPILLSWKYPSLAENWKKQEQQNDEENQLRSALVQLKYGYRSEIVKSAITSGEIAGKYVAHAGKKLGGVVGTSTHIGSALVQLKYGYISEIVN